MGMEINATLIVQAFHFFVAYLLFRTLFFRPAVKAIQEEQQEKDGLKSVLAEREVALEKKSEEKKRAWQKAQEQFAQATPPVVGSRVERIDVEPAEAAELPSNDEIESLAEDVKQVIIKKVSGRHE